VVRYRAALQTREIPILPDETRRQQAMATATLTETRVTTLYGDVDRGDALEAALEAMDATTPDTEADVYRAGDGCPRCGKGSLVHDPQCRSWLQCDRDGWFYGFCTFEVRDGEAKN